MADFNKVILIGRLTKDLELKVTQSGIPVVSGSIAVNRSYKQGEERKADFINFTAWRGTAGFIARYFHQGSNIHSLREHYRRATTRQTTAQSGM